MSTQDTSDVVMVESSAGVATATVSKITGNRYAITIREVTGSGTIAFTVKSTVGEDYETLYESDGSTAQTMTLGSEQTLIVDGRLYSVKATSTDSPLPTFTLAVSRA